MAKPRLILHIGTHKTGTTAIQNSLEKNRERYLAEGVFYPPTDREPWPHLPKHCSVYAACARGDAAAAAAERDIIERQMLASGAHTLVLSEEGLSEPLPRFAQFFAPWAERYDIQVLCFLRRPDLFTESLYNQFVREPARREARSIQVFSRAKGVRDRLDYAQVLDHWRTLPARVTAMDYDQATELFPLVQVFCRAAAIPTLDLSDQRANSSPDMRLIHILRYLNHQQLPCNLARLIEAAGKLDADARFQRNRHALGRLERQRLLQELEPGLARLDQQYGVRFSTELPAGEDAAAAEQVDPAYLLELLARVS